LRPVREPHIFEFFALLYVDFTYFREDFSFSSSSSSSSSIFGFGLTIWLRLRRAALFAANPVSLHCYLQMEKHRRPKKDGACPNQPPKQSALAKWQESQKRRNRSDTTDANKVNYGTNVSPPNFGVVKSDSALIYTIRMNQSGIQRRSNGHQW
jgi:hypothetical protein